MAAGNSSLQSENTKKLILGIVVTLLILLVGWRIYGGTRGNEEAAHQIEQSVSQASGPVGLPGIYRKMNAQAQNPPATTAQRQTPGK